MGNKPSAKNKYQAGRADTGATIAETAAAATRTPTTTVCVYIVRHAQRADEVSVEEFRDRAQELDMRGIRPQKWYDPPLTNRGVQQASACAAQLATLQASGVLFSRVYSSPFQRTMQTAQEIAAALKLDICPSHALGLVFADVCDPHAARACFLPNPHPTYSPKSQIYRHVCTLYNDITTTCTMYHTNKQTHTHTHTHTCTL